MKNLFILLILVTSLVYSQTQYRFNINNINLPIDNKGVLADVNIGPDGPGGRFGNGTFLFSSGFMVSGYNADTLWACGQGAGTSDFIPGNVDSIQTNPVYKIYINNNTSAPNYSEWQDYTNAVSIGADFYDGNGDGIYNPVDVNGNGQWDSNEDKPDIIGDKTTWCVYNDGTPGNQKIMYPGVNPVGLEIHQTLFGYNSTFALGNVIFIRYKLINTGKANSILKSVYFSSWADPDLGSEYQDDLVGCDTLRQSGFIYNGDGNDPTYGSAIPAFFTRYLEGPVSYIPGETFIDNNSNGIYDNGIDTPLKTAHSRKGKYLGTDVYPGAKNLTMTSYTHFQFGSPILTIPTNQTQVNNYMNGKTPGGQLANPCAWGGVFGGVNCQNVNPFYWYSGDPVTNIGWIHTTPNDQMTMVNTGPFDLEVGKPITIIVAYIVGQGTNRLNSITKAREIAEYTHNFYLSNFGEFPVSVNENPLTQLPNDFSLFQNYPNPFNPSTKINWQSPVGSWQTLKVYDVLGNEVTTLVDEYRNAGSYEVEFNPSVGNHQLASGIYFYRLQVGDFVQTKKMTFLK